MERIDHLVFVSLKVVLLLNVEHEVVMRTRDERREKEERRIINKARDREHSDAQRILF